jgi:4-hydroxyphenylpyruvate dioxygenase
MEIDHLHFYVEDADQWQHWLHQCLGFSTAESCVFPLAGANAVLKGAQITLAISAPAPHRPGVKAFLRRYAEGVADVAFRVRHLDRLVERAVAAGATMLDPVQQIKDATGSYRWCRVQGWGSLCHTLLEFAQPQPEAKIHASLGLPWSHIDHAVLNVPQGELEPAVAWYEVVLGFQRRQSFAIATPHSGLKSVVLKHPDGGATLPINEPTSANSQVQEFLTHHRGAGIQHAALQTEDLVQTVKRLRQLGVAFLSVPNTYYAQIQQRPGFGAQGMDWFAIAQQQILVDWSLEMPEARLLQTFTQPLFQKPTFFLELIERQRICRGDRQIPVEGFGEGNFQALFEAIERQQQHRGSL